MRMVNYTFMDEDTVYANRVFSEAEFVYDCQPIEFQTSLSFKKNDIALKTILQYGARHRCLWSKIYIKDLLIGPEETSPQDTYTVDGIEFTEQGNYPGHVKYIGKVPGMFSYVEIFYTNAVSTI